MISFSPYWDHPETTLEALNASADRRIREIAELAAGLRYPRGLPPPPKKKPPKPNPRGCKRPVRCLETGQEYESICDAARAVGVWPNAIVSRMGAKMRKPGVLHFEFVLQLRPQAAGR